MMLLTWHGTVVCLLPEGGGLVHLPADRPFGDGVPLDVALPDTLASEPVRVPSVLGTLQVQHGSFRRSVSLARYGQFLCAEPHRAAMTFDRDQIGLWETFLPISAPDLADLADVLSHDWIVASSRMFVPRRAVRLAPEFRLMAGPLALDLAQGLPLLAEPAAASGERPAAFRLPDGGAGALLVRARPDGSALVETQAWPVRARRDAQIMALAAHRGVRGVEPEQAELDADVAFLLGGGPGGLTDLLARLRPGRGGPAGAAAAAEPPACPVVSLGLGHAAAQALRDAGLAGAPMPFDLINATPAMVRHCIATDFAMLLDRTQYASQPGAGDAAPACAHAFFAEQFDVERVFEGSDPTEDAAYRALEEAVDRFRSLLASAEPVMFVQIGHADSEAAAAFAATAALLGRVAPKAMLVAVAVQPPDRRLAVPLLALAAAPGVHRFYVMTPTSQFEAAGFARQVDQDCIVRLLAAHAAAPATAPATVTAERERLMQALSLFNAARPAPGDGAAEDGRAITEIATAALHEAGRLIGLPQRYGFGLFDARSVDASLSQEAMVVEIGAAGVTLRVDAGARSPWVLMERAVSLIVLLDEALSRTPIINARFFAEMGDGGWRGDSVTFCSAQPGALLLPDPDFMITGGYEEQRQAALDAPFWEERRRVVFWRGATTGRPRQAAPEADADDDFTWLPRLDMVHRARRSPHPELYDVGIASLVQKAREPGMADRIAAAGLLAARAPRTAFLECRAILVIDGNTNAWSALFGALLSGACVLLVASEHGFRQWYYDRLKPWIHVVPVRADLSDMDEVVAWVMSHDDDARAIGEAGRALALSMTFEAEIARAAEALGAWLAGRTAAPWTGAAPLLQH